MHVADQFVVKNRIATSVFLRYRPQARYGEQRLEYILERRDPALEIVHNACGIPPLVLHALEHPTFDLFFSHNGGKVGKRKVVIAFEMHPFGHELLTPLIVDDLCNGIRELLIFGIARSLSANAVTLHHPTSAKPEQGS